MILFAIKSLNGVAGGAERVFVDVVNGLKNRGRDVEVLTFDLPGPSFYPLDPCIQRHDMAFHPPNVPTPRIGYMRAIPRIRKTVKAMRPDAVVAFMHSTYVPLSLALSGMHPRLLVSEHTAAKHYEGRWFQRTLRRIVDRRACVRTVPSQAVLPGYLSEGAVESVVISNPVMTGKFCQLAEAAPQHPPLILSVGVLRPEKAHPILLHAFARVAPVFPDWRLRLLGDGPERQKIQDLVTRLGLDTRVEMPGASRDVFASYASSSFTVLASYYEAFPMAAAESLASGRAVLGFDDCAGVCGMVTDDHNGILVPGRQDEEGRIDSLAKGLFRLITDRDLREKLGRAGPKSVEPYSLDAVLDRWDSVIARTLSR